MINILYTAAFFYFATYFIKLTFKTFVTGMLEYVDNKLLEEMQQQQHILNLRGITDQKTTEDRKKWEFIINYYMYATTVYGFLMFIFLVIYHFISSAS